MVDKAIGAWFHLRIQRGVECLVKTERIANNIHLGTNSVVVGISIGISPLRLASINIMKERVLAGV